MNNGISRRSFLTLSAAFLAVPPAAIGEETVPALLDHILLGCNNLETGIAFVQQHTGVRAAFGGVHPGRGTQNALLSLGDRHYLEIIAPDPAQTGVTNPLAPFLHSLSEPKLVGWAAHPGDLGAFAKKLGEAGIAFTGPTPGSRKRPDGRLLQWKTLNLKDDQAGLLPFFIKWAADDSPHPAGDAPSGCRLVCFELVTPDPEVLKKTVSTLSLDVNVAKGANPHLRASFKGPKGQLDLGS